MDREGIESEKCKGFFFTVISGFIKASVLPNDNLSQKKHFLNIMRQILL